MKSALKEDIGFYRTSRFDVIFIVLIILLSATLILRTIRGYARESSKSTVALIYREGEVVEEVDLEKERTFTLDEGEIEIEVKGGKIRIVKADCPRGICINSGWIRHTGQSIVCLPNKVLIETRSADTPFLDVIVH